MSRFMFWGAVLAVGLSALWVNYAHARLAVAAAGMHGDQLWLVGLVPELLIVAATAELVRERDLPLSARWLAVLLLAVGIGLSATINVWMALATMPPGDPGPVALRILMWVSPTVVSALVWPIADQRVRRLREAASVDQDAGAALVHVDQARASAVVHVDQHRPLWPQALAAEVDDQAEPHLDEPDDQPVVVVADATIPRAWLGKPWPKGREGMALGRTWALEYEAREGRLPSQGEIAEVSGWAADQQAKRVLQGIRRERDDAGVEGDEGRVTRHAKHS